MKKISIIILLLLLQGCIPTRTETRIVEVKVPVIQSCIVDSIPIEPNEIYIKDTHNIRDKVQIILENLEEYIIFSHKQKAIIEGCDIK